MTANTKSITRAARTAGVVLLLMMALLVSTAPMAWAGGPNMTKTSMTVSRAEGDLADMRGNDCDGDGYNDYTLEMQGREIVKVWPDGKVQVQANWHGKAWVDGGDSVRIHHAFTLVFGADGSFKAIGLPFGLFGDPGGPLIKDAGLLRIDARGFHVAGPHDLLEFFGLDPNAATCAALGL